MPPDRVLTVSQLTRRVRALLEGEIGRVWVTGEISNYRRQASGHHYFTLKDEGAQLSCVLFRGDARNVDVSMGDGLQVEVHGQVTVYEPQGKYQMIVRLMQLQGRGELQARFEALKARLHGEGLFDQERKQPVPGHPSVIALVTSATGAAVRDMLNVFQRRAPWLRVLIAPVAVQGRGAARQIAHAIDHLNRHSGGRLPAIDTIIAGRGGGSLEDLWPFNEEIVARAIADSRLPVISAVGHETDFTIADFTADLRAPTPSAAAELAVPDAAELGRMMREGVGRLRQPLMRRVSEIEGFLNRSAEACLRREPGRQLAMAEQRRDEVEERLRRLLLEKSGERDQKMERLLHRLQRAHPAARLRERQQRLEHMLARLRAGVHQRVEAMEHELDSRRNQLRALGPESALARGFSLTYGEDGSLLRDAGSLGAGARIRTKLAKGWLESRVEEAGDEND